MTSMAEKGTVRVHCFNPYATRFPNRRVVSTAALLFAKEMRHRGHAVIFEPDDETELNYIRQYGLENVLSDPLWAFLVGIPTSVAASVAANVLFGMLKKRARENDALVALEFSDDGNSVRYSHTGSQLSDARFQALLDGLDRRTRAFAEVAAARPADLARPFPVLEEHKPPIVGWARLWETATGLGIDARITSNSTMERISSGNLQGYSVGGLVRKARCSKCSRSFMKCNHPSGVADPMSTIATIEQFDVAEVSLVRDPAFPLESVQIRGPRQ